MLYRGQPVRTPCHQHAANEATGTCSGCLRPICDICSSFVAQELECVPCARNHRRRRTAWRALAAAAIVLLAGGFVGVGAYVVTRPPAFDYGVDGNTVARLEGLLAAAPCEPATIVELLETMERARNHAGTVARAAGFQARCGDYYRIHWVTYSAWESLGEHRKAAAEATVLIDHKPDDKDYWWWRGKAWEGARELEKAAADYRQALVLQPELTGVPQMLASVYERLGKPCDAYDVLARMAEENPDTPDAVWADSRMAEIDREAHCRVEQLQF